MSTPILIKDPDGKTAELHKGLIPGEPTGLRVYSSDAREYLAAGVQLSDASGSTEMAVNAAIVGAPDPAYIDATTANWTQTALAGIWDFASTAITPQGGTECIDATATINADSFVLEKSSTVDMANYSAFSGYVYLVTFDPARHEIQLHAALAGVTVGVTVDVTNYVNTGSLGVWQKFVIPKSAMSITSEIIDQLVFTTVRTSGSPPNYYLDTINIEQSGAVLFSFFPPKGMTFEIASVSFIFSDNVTVIEPEQIMGVAALTNGIQIRTQVGGITRFSGGIKTFTDLLAIGANLDSVITGAAASTVKFVSSSPGTTSRLTGNDGDGYSISISDDLSTLSSFKVLMRGRILQ